MQMKSKRSQIDNAMGSTPILYLQMGFEMRSRRVDGRAVSFYRFKRHMTHTRIPKTVSSQKKEFSCSSWAWFFVPNLFPFIQWIHFPFIFYEGKLNNFHFSQFYIIMSKFVLSAISAHDYMKLVKSWNSFVLDSVIKLIDIFLELYKIFNFTCEFLKQNIFGPQTLFIRCYYNRARFESSDWIINVKKRFKKT